ncbi:response regulator [Desulfuribacillus alkaliarsenatis]|uniref:Response regulatory domain-containing protein n=1 Tax=Desulfuribacillus alkaliarsenatis TaxID=766136 RepID=A0A1E5G0U4_9FIRM|nr:response regulator [Desulfuribacillus alkaliarsenatis]OEF96525.1 hypothetical protein BHF68_07685 [Desulfuribacillus alkaliarsenatis]
MKILVVEDSKLYQRAVVKYLKPLLPEADFYFASDGEEGFMLFNEIKPDAMTIDLLMPKMTGDALIKKLKEQEHNTKIIVLSADVQKIVQDEVVSLGAAFFSKPLNEEKAEQMVQIIKKT